MKHRIIAINLPQFHPFKENDEWWGKGFTEWTNVTKARPRFKGHYQPHLPSDTGFYDLRLPEARKMQADLAKEHGIYGFCYYHYWFNGKQLMQRPVNDILSSGEPDFPFMLCWANENWARNWDGGFSDILIKQNYSNEDDENHIRWLCKNVFCDKRYIKVDNKPVFSVYRIALFPNIKKTIAIWRDIAKKEFGIELYLIYADYPDSYFENHPKKLGFDASFDFQPITAYTYTKTQNYKTKKTLQDLLQGHPFLNRFKFICDKINKIPDLFSYKDYINIMKSKEFLPYRFPCISPGFDNSPRRQNKTYMCFYDSTPQLYGEWLSNNLERFNPFSTEENFIFINAWNEWAEGNHLEPDQKWGTSYLEETKKAIEKTNNKA